MVAPSKPKRTAKSRANSCGAKLLKNAAWLSFCRRTTGGNEAFCSAGKSKTGVIWVATSGEMDLGACKVKWENT